MQVTLYSNGEVVNDLTGIPVTAPIYTIPTFSN